MNPIALIEIREPADDVILVATPRRNRADRDSIDEHIEELARLADTAGANVVGQLVQRVNKPNPSTFIGSGKLEQLRSDIVAKSASLAIFDDELTPAQGKALESALNVRVMDRAELILDIFATRARTKEAKMQVELAQLEYLMPRLARMWVHLSRIRGGIGLRGPGETQIETDRRMIRRRISQLKKNLERVTKHRDVLRRGRRNMPTAALVGYTNSGKSSLLKALTGANPLIEDRLFATLDTLTREFVVDGRRIRLIDTVGFVRKLPHHLVASFRSTLEEADQADLLLHVVDSSHSHWEDQIESAEKVLSELELSDRSVLYVFNKVDLLEDRGVFEAQARQRYPNSVFVSAAQGRVDDLKAALADRALLPGYEREQNFKTSATPLANESAEK